MHAVYGHGPFIEGQTAHYGCTSKLRGQQTVFKKLGGSPTAVIHAVDVNTTRENLQVAKAGEEYERDMMYPNFIKEAEATGQKEATRSFTLAMKAEAVHAQLYGAALADLDAQRISTTFYVCLICGEVTDKPEDTESCPICGAVKEKFVAVK